MLKFADFDNLSRNDCIMIQSNTEPCYLYFLFICQMYNLSWTTNMQHIPSTPHIMKAMKETSNRSGLKIYNFLASQYIRVYQSLHLIIKNIFSEFVSSLFFFLAV